MNKQLIGFLRVIAALVLMYGFDLGVSPFEIRLWVSDLIHGAHTPELRHSASVVSTMLVILGLYSFYTFQTLGYIFVPALQERNTSLFNFVKIAIRGLRDVDSLSSDSNDSSDYDRINKVLSYRDNKMAFMSNKDAAEFMKGTGHIDMMLSRPDLKQSRKALSYMNNKMSFMSNESALSFMKK